MGLSHPLDPAEKRIIEADQPSTARWPVLRGLLLSLWAISILSASMAYRAEAAAIAPRLFDHLANLILLIVLVLVLHAVGRAAARLLSRPPSATPERFLSPTPHGDGLGAHPFSDRPVAALFYIGLGFGVLSLVLFFLGLFQLYYRVTGYLLLAGGLALAFLDRRHTAGWVQTLRGPAYPWSWSERLLTGLLLLIVLSGLISSLAPPFLGDDMVYHLSAPKTYLRHHGLVDIPSNVYTYFPKGTEMLYTLALLVKGDILAKLLHYLMGVLLLITIYLTCRRLALNRRMALLAALFFGSIPTVWFLMSWAAYVDLTLTFFLLLAVLAYIGSWYSLRREWLLLCGLFYGCALGTKYTALSMLPVLFCALLLRLRRNLGEPSPAPPSVGRAVAREVLWPIGLALLSASPWYLKNLYYTGNPFFPFFLDIIRVNHPGWDAERAANYMVMLGHYGRPVKSLFSYLMLPWDVTMHARLIDPRAYDGILGPIFLMTLPLFLLRRSWPLAARILGGFALAYFLVWSLSTQQIRFLVPMLPALCILSAFLLSDETGPAGQDPTRRSAPWRRFLVGLTVLAVLFNTSVIAYYLARVDPFPYFFGQESRDEYLSKHLDYYDLYTYINKTLPSSSKVFLIDMGNFDYYLERAHFSDSIFEDYTIGKVVSQSRSSDEIRTRLQAMGVTHLLYCQSLLFHKDLMPFDPAGLSRFTEFLQRHGRLLKTDRNFLLWEIQHD